MGKSAKTFTIDIKILSWLEEYARKNNRKESAVVNSVLRDVMRSSQTWKCPECNEINDVQFNTCHGGKTFECDGMKA